MSEANHFDTLANADVARMVVAELDHSQREALPMAARIGLRLLADEGLLQQTPFDGSKINLIPAVLTKEVGLDSESTEDVQLVKDGLKALREDDYLMFETMDLPVVGENFKHEPVEHLEMHIRLILQPKFEHVFRGTVAAAQETFSKPEEE